MKNLLLFFYLLMQGVVASAVQDHAQLREKVGDFVKTQTASMPGKVSFQVDEIDRRIALADCTKVEAFLPPGSRLIGRTNIGVRCNDANGWSVLIPVLIKIRIELAVSAHQLPMGYTLNAEDIAMQSSEAELNSGISDPKLIIGKVMRYSLAAGQILRHDMLRAPYSVKQGQTIRLNFQSGGLSIRGEGVALTNASEGQAVQIRTQGGRVISGIANADGTVEIRP